MAFLEAPDAKKNFNWDDIDVGNHRLDHSQNFFAKPHMKHEKLDETELFNAKLAKVELDDDDISNTVDAPTEEEDKENTITEQQKSSPTKEVKSEENSQIKIELHDSITTINNESIEKAAIKDLPLKETPVVKKAVVLACWSTQKPVVSKTIKAHLAGTAPKLQPHTPNAYKYKDIYERKKKQLEQQTKNEERKMREFHSHPAPNFNALHERLQKRVVVYEVTHPITPQTLKRSQEAVKKVELRKELLEKEADKFLKEKKHFQPQPVPNKEPFLPHKPSRLVVPMPFQMHSEKRLEERKLYDMEVQRSLEEKRKKCIPALSSLAIRQFVLFALLILIVLFQFGFSTFFRDLQ